MASLTPLLNAGPLIASHAFAAIGALCLGTAQMVAPKGTINHRVLGYLWCILMMWVAGSSLFIFGFRLIGPFGPIHFLSLLTLVAVPAAVIAARYGRISTHKRAMTALFFWALIVAGLFTFVPGRIMHSVVFGS
ncbi:DUF2306 domain-containing protein [Roseibium algae]|uniref:DUF2306 domain-containing protein n=1 Tax=Roseibium algae TaxID=3123038 RepID=A0ABU8TK35_9HYPH